MSSKPAPPRQESRLSRRLARDQRPRSSGQAVARAAIALGVLTLSLGLAVLALATRLDVNEVTREPPHLALSQEPGEGLQVLRAEDGLAWSDLVLDGNCTAMLNGHPLGDTPTKPVQAGDVLTCLPGESVQIFSSRQRGDAVLYAAEFPDDLARAAARTSGVL